MSSQESAQALPGRSLEKTLRPHWLSDPNEPVDEKYGDAAFARDLPITKHIPADKVQVVYPKYQDVERYGRREFPWPFEFDLGPIRVEVYESGESARPDLPTCAYLVSHAARDVAIFHTGDLHGAYPPLENLRGRVDYLVHMKTPMEPLINAVQPKFVIPTHYRTDRQAEPIPAGHWPPNLTDVNAFLEDLREQIDGKAQLLPFTAPIQYEVEMPGQEG